MAEAIEPSSAKSGESGGGSRFSQFFSKPAAGEQPANLAKLEQNNVDELGTNEFTSIKIPSPGDPSAYFAPISPAAKTENPSNPIMDLLRGGSAKTESELLAGAKATCPPMPQMEHAQTAEELEANIKHLVGIQEKQPQPPQQQPHQPEGEMSAFKKFVSFLYVHWFSVCFVWFHYLCMFSIHFLFFRFYV